MNALVAPDRVAQVLRDVIAECAAADRMTAEEWLASMRDAWNSAIASDGDE